MINPIFKNHEFLYNYFEALIKSKKRFPQSLVFETSSTTSAYFFTLELARILNCTKNGEYNCDCTSCKWIRENAHPSVISVNPLNFKEDNTKTVISVKQIEKITSLIVEASDYHRFFIFSGAKEENPEENERELIEEFENLGYTFGEDKYILTPINRKILQEEASNALLKSVEEAPDKVTFVFLTNSKENILQTIISRSLVFKMPCAYRKNKIDLSEFFKEYPEIPLVKIFDLVSYLTELSSKYGTEAVLTCLQENLLELLCKNVYDINLIKSDIKTVQTTKDMIKAQVMPKYALENMLLSMSYEGRNL